MGSTPNTRHREGPPGPEGACRLIDALGIPKYDALSSPIPILTLADVDNLPTQTGSRGSLCAVVPRSADVSSTR